MISQVLVTATCFNYICTRTYKSVHNFLGITSHLLLNNVGELEVTAITHLVLNLRTQEDIHCHHDSTRSKKELTV